MRKLLFLLIVCLPATGWSADLHYVLDVQISTDERKITGTARIKAYADIKIGLCVRNLRELKVNGSADVNTADDSIRLTVQEDKEIIISYEAMVNKTGANFIDKENRRSLSGLQSIAVLSKSRKETSFKSFSFIR